MTRKVVGRTLSDETSAREFPHLRLVDGWLRAEIEAGQVAHEREAGQAKAHIDPALITARDLAFAEQRQRLADRHFPTAGLVDQAVELVPQGRELQAIQHGDQVIVAAH